MQPVATGGGQWKEDQHVQPVGGQELGIPRPVRDDGLRLSDWLPLRQVRAGLPGLQGRRQHPC